MQSHMSSHMIEREASFSVKSQAGERLQKMQTPIIQKHLLRKEDFHFIFGKFKPNMTDE